MERAWERHGFDLSTADLIRFREDIESGVAISGGTGRGGAEYWDVVHQGRLVRILYDPERRHVITVLPANATGFGAKLR